MTIIGPIQMQLDDLNKRLTQVEIDIEAIAQAIKRNNETTESILQEVINAKEIPIIREMINASKNQ